MQYFWLALVYSGQVFLTFAPVFSDDFGYGGLSATIFLWALFTAHFIIFIRNINILFPLGILPPILLTQAVLLTLVFTNSDYFIDVLFSGNREPFDRLHNIGYGSIFRTFVIQGLISFAATSGIWIGKKFDKFLIRKSAYDLDELENIYKFRKKLLPDSTPAFYRFRPLYLKGLILLGMKRHRILGLMHTLWQEDTIIIREILIDPDQKDEPDMVRSFIISMIHRPEIVNSNANEVVLLVSGDHPEITESAHRIGFRDHPWPDPALTEKLKDYVITGEDAWDPFDQVKYALRIPLTRVNENA